MKPAQIESFFATLQAANPMPVTELEYTSVFELLAAPTGTPHLSGGVVVEEMGG